MNFYEGLLYREAHGLAADLLRGRWLDTGPCDRKRASPTAGNPELIRADVTRRVLITKGDVRAAELVQMGVEDALAGQQPRW
jgi:hypothetical protein